MWATLLQPGEQVDIWIKFWATLLPSGEQVDIWETTLLHVDNRQPHDEASNKRLQWLPERSNTLIHNIGQTMHISQWSYQAEHWCRQSCETFPHFSKQVLTLPVCKLKINHYIDLQLCTHSEYYFWFEGGYQMHAEPKCDQDVSITAAVLGKQSVLHRVGLGKFGIRSFRVTMWLKREKDKCNSEKKAALYCQIKVQEH